MLVNIALYNALARVRGVFEKVMVGGGEITVDGL